MNIAAMLTTHERRELARWFQLEHDSRVALLAEWRNDPAVSGPLTFAAGVLMGDRFTNYWQEVSSEQA